ncbi:MAG: hypothetical protein AB9888_00080 [Bacteroidales bacterium]
MEIETLLESALRSTNPEESLIKLLKELIAQGYTRENLLGILSACHLKLMADGRDEDDDRILEVADYLEGWCSPNMKI